MKITVKCEKCGNELEIKSDTRGNIAYFSQELQNKNFDIYNSEIAVELEKDIVTDENDVDAELKELRIDCQKCGEYIILEF